MSIRMKSVYALVFPLLFTAGCSTTSQVKPNQEQATQSPHWSTCMAKSAVALGIPGAAYSMATGGAALVTGALIGGTACAYLDPVTDDSHNFLVPNVQGMTIVNFGFNSTDLRADSLEKIHRVSREFVEGNVIELVGHASDIGSPEYNQGLSERRAEAVKRYLVEQGFPEEKITVQGEGDKRPVRSNETDEMRAENRRVEINLIK